MRLTVNRAARIAQRDWGYCFESSQLLTMRPNWAILYIINMEKVSLSDVTRFTGDDDSRLIDCVSELKVRHAVDKTGKLIVKVS